MVLDFESFRNSKMDSMGVVSSLASLSGALVSMVPSNSLATGIAEKNIGLEAWMGRALELCSKVDEDWDADKIHDLRVALRRSRAMAEGLAEVNPAPGWKKIKKSSRQLFHALGDLRDVQVEKAWIQKLGRPGDPIRRHLLGVLSRQERRHRQGAERAIEEFDRKGWRRLCRKLSAKARFFPLESVVYQRLALARLNDAVDLFQQARKKRSSFAWHRSRIGIKHFRYIVENFLPQRYEVWAEDLKRLQDLLGEVHDLDVLRAEIRKQPAGLDPAGKAQWLARIKNERQQRLEEVLSKNSAKDSPWIVWRAGFHWGHALVAATFPQRRIA